MMTRERGTEIGVWQIGGRAGPGGKERSLWDTGVSEPWLREFPIQLGSKKLGFSFIFLE